MKIGFGFGKEFEIKVILPKDDIQGAVDVLKQVDLSENILNALEQAKQRNNST